MSAPSMTGCCIMVCHLILLNLKSSSSAPVAVVQYSQQTSITFDIRYFSSTNNISKKSWRHFRRAPVDINNVCKACYYHIRSLRHVHQSLPDDVARTVACSIVTSRIDYCNSVYVGMSASNLTNFSVCRTHWHELLASSVVVTISHLHLSSSIGYLFASVSPSK